jgi:hypothetical protein
MIESLEFRNEADQTVEGYTVSSPPWIVSPGYVRSVDDSFTAIRVVVRDTFGMASDTVTVPVLIDSTDGLGICALEFSVCLEGSLIQFSSVDTQNTLLAASGWFFHYVLEDETLSVAAAGASDLSGAGPLLNLHLEVDGVASPGCSTLVRFDSLLVNESGAGPDGFGEDGTFIVVSRWGDVSGDTEVHAYDAASLLKWIVDPDGSPLFHHQLIVGDVDLDGEITAYDASLILQYVVGTVDELPYPGLKSTPAVLRLEDFEGTRGDTVSLALSVDDGRNLYSVEGTILYASSVLELLRVRPIVGGHLYWQKGAGEAEFVLASSREFVLQQRIVEFDFVVLPSSDEVSTVLLRDLRLNNLPLQQQGGSAQFKLLRPGEIAGTPRLYFNRPNPFREETDISFTLGREAPVQLRVYNSAGELVNTIVDEVHDHGSHSYRWNGRDGCGRRLSSGVYFCRMVTEGYSATRKMSMIQ